jgi:hypothetical protein
MSNDEDSLPEDERPDSLDNGPPEKELRVPPGEVVSPGEVLPTPDEKIADAGDEEREGGAGDSDIERGRS